MLSELELKQGDEIGYDDPRLESMSLEVFIRQCELRGLSPIPDGNRRAYVLHPSEEVDLPEWIPILVRFGFDLIEDVREGIAIRPAIEDLLQGKELALEPGNIILFGGTPDEKRKGLPVHSLQVIRTGETVYFTRESRGA